MAISLAGAAPAGAAPATGGEAGALIRAERGWMAAMVRRDPAGLRRFLDPGFTLSATLDLDRQPVPAPAWLDNALHHLVVERFDFGTMRAEEKGDVGIVRAHYRWRGAFDGERFDDGGSLVDFWRRRDGRWRVVARVIVDEPTAAPSAH